MSTYILKKVATSPKLPSLFYTFTLVGVLASHSALHAGIESEGTGIIGVSNSTSTTLGTPHTNAGTATNLNDGNLASLVDTFNGDIASPAFSYVGVTWNTARSESITGVTLHLATYLDGGWFGPNGAGPGAGGALQAATHLTVPTVQVSTDNGTTWTSVPAATNDYISVLDGFTIGGGANPNPRITPVSFTLNNPVSNINGIRLIGSEGGTADGTGFLGAAEFIVQSTASSDRDADTLLNDVETNTGVWVSTSNTGTDPDDSDSDDDGIPDNLENPDLPFMGANQPGTDPNKADSDGDGVSDQLEITLGSNPTSSSSVPQPPAGSGLLGPEPVSAYFNGNFPSQAPPDPTNIAGITSQQVFSGLNFVQPLFIDSVPGQNKFVVASKLGQIHTFDANEATASLNLMLDINAVDAVGDVYTDVDSGLFSMAFHPQWPTQNYIYVCYKWRPDNDNGIAAKYAFWRLSRFTVNTSTLVADPASESIYIQQFVRDDIHDGGHILFGDDGFLYVGNGDEGGQGDAFNVSQKINDRFLSGYFRIDVDNDTSKSHAIPRQPNQTLSDGFGDANPWLGTHDSFTQGYMIPDDNPFVGQTNVLEEFYALGFRNPFSAYKHPTTGEIFIGDVGDGAPHEELNRLTSGGNFQWDYKEGNTTRSATPSPLIGTDRPPVWTYSSGLGRCIVAGQVYNGTSIGTLVGKHIVCDHQSSRVWALTIDGDTVTNTEQLFGANAGGTNQGICSIGRGPDGELYYVNIRINGTGQMFKIVPDGGGGEQPPATLSATGLFSDLTTLTPAQGLFPFNPGSPLWSDYAEKKRWISIPNGGDGVHTGADETIVFDANGNWRFPAGTVLVKHFELPTDENNPALTRRLETRVTVVLADASIYAVTYRWREDGTDADLLPGGASDNIQITLTGGGTMTQTWDYPTRANCFDCHTPQSGYVLGPRTHQLNNNLVYPRTGVLANQLQTMHSLGWFGDSFDPSLLPYMLRANHLEDTSLTLEDRVRAYLDSNCSHCHQPGGVRANFDARYTTSLHEQNLIHGTLFTSFLGTGEAVIKPGDVSKSVVHFRMNARGNNDQMPPLGTNEMDTLALQQISAWVSSLQDRAGVKLSASSATSSTFNISVQFTKAVTDLTASDFSIFGASVTSLTDSGDGMNYTLQLTSSGNNGVSIILPENKTLDSGGLGNFPSNLLNIGTVINGLATSLDFDEVNSGTTPDSSDTGNNGTLINMPADPRVTGHCGQAFDFNGSNNYVQIQNSSADSFTVSLWLNSAATLTAINTGDFPRQWLVHANITGLLNDWGIGLGNIGGVDKAIFFTGDEGNPNTFLETSSDITTDTWVHLAVTRDSTTGVMKIYVNGVEEGSVTGGTNTLNVKPQLEIGSNGSGGLDGLIDEFQIYNRVLSFSEIQALQTCATGQQSPYLEWAQTNFPGLNHLQGFHLDTDGDGLINILEWAFGGNALALDPNPVSAATSNSSGGLTLTFPRLKENAPQYKIMVSEDMVSWFDAGADAVEQNVQDTAGSTEMVTYEYTGSMGAGGRLFARIEVVD